MLPVLPALPATVTFSEHEEAVERVAQDVEVAQRLADVIELAVEPPVPAVRQRRVLEPDPVALAGRDAVARGRRDLHPLDVDVARDVEGVLKRAVEVVRDGDRDAVAEDLLDRRVADVDPAATVDADAHVELVGCGAERRLVDPLRRPSAGEVEVADDLHVGQPDVRAAHDHPVAGNLSARVRCAVMERRAVGVDRQVTLVEDHDPVVLGVAPAGREFDRRTVGLGGDEARELPLHVDRAVRRDAGGNRHHPARRLRRERRVGRRRRRLAAVCRTTTQSRPTLRRRRLSISVSVTR